MKKAFTLLETIIALAILTIGILAIAQIFPFTLKLTELGAHITTAANLAQGTLEEELSKAYEDMAVGSTSPATYGGDFSHFSYQTDIAYVDENLNELISDKGMKKIVVTVSWSERGKNKQTQLATIINDN